MKAAVLFVFRIGDQGLRPVDPFEQVRKGLGQADMGTVRRKKLLGDIWSGEGTTHVLQGAHDTGSQSKQKVVGFVQLSLLIETVQLQPARRRQGQHVVEHVPGAGVSDAQVAVGIHVGDVEGGL